MSGTTESKLTALASGQWGLLTTAQAGEVGIRRSTILRRERSGSLERLRPGVYRLAGSPAHRLDEIRAAWVATEPRASAWERVADPDVVIGGAAAAWAHEIGDLYPSPYLMYTRTRRQTLHDDVRYRSRHLPAADITFLEGLPVTTRERTIADLLDGADLSLVADALRDAERADGDLDVEALVAHLNSHAKRFGFASGAELYAELRTLAGVDANRLRDLVQSTDITERLNAVIAAQVQEALAPLQADLDALVRAALGPIQQQLTEQIRTAVAPIYRATIPTIGAPAMRVPRVRLPESVLPQIALTPEAQAALRDLRQQILQIPPARQAGTATRSTAAAGTEHNASAASKDSV